MLQSLRSLAPEKCFQAPKAQEPLFLLKYRKLKKNSHLIKTSDLIGLEYKLLWVWGTGMAASRVASLLQFSGWPKSGNADSEPKSRAPNCTLSTDSSAEPGISTAVDGICIHRQCFTSQLYDYCYKLSLWCNSSVIIFYYNY